MKNEMQLNLIELKFTYNKPSGEEIIISGQISGEYGWQQWGETEDKLGDNVEVIEAINNAVQEFLMHD